MTSPRLRRAIAIIVLTAASVILPLSDLSAAPRHEARWSGPERVVRQTLSFWHVLTSIFETTGLRIDSNG
jgi:hypothetical protein